MLLHKDWLYRFCRRYLGDAEEAADIVQESFISAWMNLARFDPNRPFGAWLRQIARNKCRDRDRRHSVQRAFRILVAGIEQVESGDFTADLGRDETLQRLELAIARLPRLLKEALILTALEGYSQEQAAQLLGANTRSIEARVYRARKALAASLNKDDIAAFATSSF